MAGIDEGKEAVDVSVDLTTLQSSFKCSDTSFLTMRASGAREKERGRERARARDRDKVCEYSARSVRSNLATLNSSHKCSDTSFLSMRTSGLRTHTIRPNQLI